MSDNTIGAERSLAAVSSISWWSWRPGIKPGNALLLGCPLALIALLMILLGLITLLAGLEDASSPPLLIAGTVIGHTIGTIVSSPQLTIQLQKVSGFHGTVTLTVPPLVVQHVPLNAPITVVYSQRLHFAYALKHRGQHYALPGASATGNPIGSLALLLLGLIILPYPALLTHWGWRDLLIEHYDRGRLCKMTAHVVDTRAITRTRTTQAGFAGRGVQPWYGIALQPFEGNFSRRVYTFSVSEKIYRSTLKGTAINITYGPHLHYVYALTL